MHLQRPPNILIQVYTAFKHVCYSKRQLGSTLKKNFFRLKEQPEMFMQPLRHMGPFLPT